MNRPVRLVVGALPPVLCGIGHYTDRLAASLRDLGVDAEAVLLPRDDLRGRTLRRLPADAIVHLQYPAALWGTSFAPLLNMVQALARRRPMLLTEHEFTGVHPLRRAMAVGLATSAAAVIVTNEHERVAMRRWVPRQHFEVIPVASNVVAIAQAAPRPFAEATAERPFTVGFFGLAMPGRGIEQFLEFAGLVHARRAPVRCVVVGGWRDEHAGAVAGWQATSAAHQVRWTGPLSDEAVSKELAALDAAYLPFPDGLSDRRTTAMAMLSHAVPTLTTDGPSTTDAQRATVTMVRAPAEALTALETLDLAQRDARVTAGLSYAEQRSWPAVAGAHLAFYEQVDRHMGRSPRRWLNRLDARSAAGLSR